MNVSETVAFIMEKADWPDHRKAARQKALLEAPTYALNILDHLLEDILDVDINERYGSVRCKRINRFCPYTSTPMRVFRGVVCESYGVQASLYENIIIQRLAEEVTFGVYCHMTYAGGKLVPLILTSADPNVVQRMPKVAGLESIYKLYVYRHAKELVRAEIARRAAKVEEPVEVAPEELTKHNATIFDLMR